MSDIAIGLGVLPAAGLILIALLSIPGEPADPPGKTKKAVVQPSQNTTQKKFDVETVHIDDSLDYQAILSYIKSKYKKITDVDAKQIARQLVDYGKEHKVDPKFAAAVIARESAFNKEAISVTGAKGLGQIKDFNFKSLKIQDPYDIKQNVKGTTKYLKKMLGKWKDDSNNVSLALASYYKGYTNVKKAEGQLDTKTKGYVNDILKYYDDLKKIRKDKENQGY